jgi:D,D-heptose 1,7-bisphosphate phosphatase
MNRPAVFFDRDNTLIVSDGYLGDPAQVRLVSGAADAVARARRLGFATVIVSNQSGVARGLFDEDAVRAVNAQLDVVLRQHNPAAIIDRHEFCPHHPEAAVERYRQESDRRKPAPGMILCAADELGLDLGRSWIVGDAPRDIEAGKAAGCQTILLRDPALPASPAAAEEAKVQPDFTASSLAEAIDYIERHMGDDGGATPPPQPNMGGRAPESPSPVAASSSAVVKSPSSLATSRSSEQLLQEILDELRRSREQPSADFSMSKLLAGISQVIAVAVVFLGYLDRDQPHFRDYLLFAIFLQTLTIALLIMGRQK